MHVCRPNASGEAQLAVARTDLISVHVNVPLRSREYENNNNLPFFHLIFYFDIIFFAPTRANKLQIHIIRNETYIKCNAYNGF